MEANNLSGYLITPNQKLKIPNGSTTTPSKTNPSTNNNVGGSGGYSSPTFSHQNLYTRSMYMVRIRPTFSSGKPISTYWSDAKYWAGNAQMVIQ